MKKHIILLIFLTLFIISVNVLAQGSTTNPGQGAPTVISQQGSQSQKCTDVTQRVGLITDRYNQNKEKYMNAFQYIYQEVNTLALQFKANGYDTDNIEADLMQFNNMIQNTTRYYNEFMNGLENSRSGVCGNSTNDPVQQFTRAREQLMLCKNEMLQLRTFAQETLRQDLLDLKDQITQ